MQPLFLSTSLSILNLLQFQVSFFNFESMRFHILYLTIEENRSILKNNLSRFDIFSQCKLHLEERLEYWARKHMRCGTNMVGRECMASTRISYVLKFQCLNAYVIPYSFNPMAFHAYITNKHVFRLIRPALYFLMVSIMIQESIVPLCMRQILYII